VQLAHDAFPSSFWNGSGSQLHILMALPTWENKIFPAQGLKSIPLHLLMGEGFENQHGDMVGTVTWPLTSL